MDLNTLVRLFENNNNIQKWNRAEQEDTIIYYFNNVSIRLNQLVASRANMTLPYYVNNRQIIPNIDTYDIEKVINIILSRDWEPQQYRRGVIMGTFDPNDWRIPAQPQNAIWYCDPLRFIYNVVSTQPAIYETNGNLSKAKSEVIIYSYCSLDKTTIDKINNLDEDAIGIKYKVSSPKSFSYQHWVGKGFYKIN